LLQILDEGGGGLVDFLGDDGDVVPDVAVVIPVAVIALDESHAALGEAAGEQAVGGEGAVGAGGCRTSLK
jgi:hypothetical protein